MALDHDLRRQTRLCLASLLVAAAVLWPGALATAEDQPVVVSLADKVAAAQHLRQLGDRRLGVRNAAARALAKMPRETLLANPTSITALVRAAGDSSPTVASAAVEALATIGAPAVPAIIAALRPKQATSRTNAYVVGNRHTSQKEFADSLTLYLDNKDAGTHTQVIQALNPTAAKKPQVVLPLTNALTDTDPTVRAAAVKALNRTGHEAATAAKELAAALGQPSTARRCNLIRTLGKIGPAARAALPVLEAAGKTGPPRVREAARRALAKVRQPAAE